MEPAGIELTPLSRTEWLLQLCGATAIILLALLTLAP
jgi:hypothetical protein